MTQVLTKAPRTSFEQSVHRFVRRVPQGRVVTYGDVAWAVGRPGASRAVGTVMRCNPDTDLTPCHRVVRSDGTVGWYAGGRVRVPEKIRLLQKEGVPVDARGRIAGFDRVRWTPRRGG